MEEQNEMMIIETVDDGEVGYMNSDGIEEVYTIEEHVDEPVIELAEQVVERHTVETLPVVYVADQLPNTGTSDYGVIIVVAMLLIVSSFGLLFSRKDN